MDKRNVTITRIGDCGRERLTSLCALAGLFGRKTPLTSSVRSGLIRTYAIEKITTTTNATLAPRIMAKLDSTSSCLCQGARQDLAARAERMTRLVKINLARIRG